ncbi:MAG: 3'-5' exonuclease [Flavobacteriales bacterium]|nr:3'-5' exonuclease [Flavobacteriales bacterium]
MTYQQKFQLYQINQLNYYEMFKKEITVDEINNLELKKYSGKVLVIDSKKLIKNSCEEIKKNNIIGIDTETKPSFQKGIKNRVSLIQIATVKNVYLFRINKIEFPDELLDIFSDIKIIKVGIAIHDDVRDLKRIKNFKERSFIDLNNLAKNFGFISIGAKKLSALVLGIRISKKQQLSNWETELLSSKQIDYAATDAWICREIFIKIKELY